MTERRARACNFAAEMILRMLDGSKRQTRRPVRRGRTLGEAGDLLFVREAARAADADGLSVVRYSADNATRPIANTPEAADLWLTMYYSHGKTGAVVPGIHMPRWVNRLTLPVVAKRVEPLQAITPEDARLEGMSGRNPVARFADLWITLYGRAAWRENPLVEVADFQLIQLNIDEVLSNGEQGVRNSEPGERAEQSGA